MKQIKIAYIGGGSRQWARGLMSDLALEPGLQGTVSLFDIDQEAAVRNAIIGNKIMNVEGARGRWNFTVATTLKDSLLEADFVFISILPGTFEAMEAYVHIPERWGVFQTVGDTAGPAGIFRSLIMMPMYAQFATAIQQFCPQAWVINFTNPMTMCIQMLYHVFPNIKAYGNCHEVFHTQDLLAKALEEKTGIRAHREEIKINPQGINHFTWINYASYKDIDLFPIYREFAEKYHAEGLASDADWKEMTIFDSGERVKLDLFRRFGVIAAAGDRHLVEFLPKDWYLTDKKTIDRWRFFLTPVSYRIEKNAKADQLARALVAGSEKVTINGSGEEGIRQLKALLGLTDLLTNVNLPNMGQISNLPLGQVVETNAIFRRDDVKPIFTGAMPEAPRAMTWPHIENHQRLLKAFDTKDLSWALEALENDVLINQLPKTDIKAMFIEICQAVRPFLNYYEKTPISLI